MSQALSIEEILNLVPQQAPFRFIDGISEIDEDHIVGHYTFKPTESFYEGHFPGNPVTPGVILLETIAQTAVVAFGIYLVSLTADKSVISQYLTLFSDANVEFYQPVYPGDTVTIEAKKIFFRRMKLKVAASLVNQKGQVVAEATLSGMGVKQT